MLADIGQGARNSIIDDDLHDDGDIVKEIDVESNQPFSSSTGTPPESPKSRSGSRIEFASLKRAASNKSIGSNTAASGTLASNPSASKLPRFNSGASKLQWAEIDVNQKIDNSNQPNFVTINSTNGGDNTTTMSSFIKGTSDAQDLNKTDQAIPVLMSETSQQANGNGPSSNEAGNSLLNEEAARKSAAREKLMNRVILLVCILCYGVGLFLVSLPSKLDATDKQTPGRGRAAHIPGFISSSVSVSLGRSLGIFVIIMSTTKGLRHSFNAGIGPGPYFQKANILGFSAPMISSIGYVTYDMLLRQGGDISVYAAATSLHTAIPALWAFVVLRERLTWKKSVGLLFAFGSVFLLSMQNDPTAPHVTNSTSATNSTIDLSGDRGAATISLLIASILLWGASLLARSAAARMRPWLNALITFFYGQMFHFVFSFVVFMGMGGYDALAEVFTPWTAFIVGGHIVISFGAVSYTKLTSGKDTATWGALTQLNIMVTILLSIIVFDEVVTPLRGLGFGLMLSSVVLLAMK